MINVAIMGHGVVGSGVAEVLLKNSKHIAEKAKNEIKIKHILDLRDFPGIAYADLFTKDFNDILNDDEVKVVAEVMGGLHPAYEFTKQCIMAGKSVVTSNKELVATFGAELLALAEENNVNYLFEASVGGGIPVLRPIAQCLAANDLYEIEGILNGTTNFILTKMLDDGMGFEEALKMAQELGYAEKDPTADVEGHDACRKICILAALAFGKHVYPDTVYTEGITKITSADAAYADFADCSIKLIGRAKLFDDGKCSATVSPCFVSRKNPLAHVNDVFNAITVKGDAIGNAMFYGPGAGKLPTASAVVADIIDCVKHLHARKYLSWDNSDRDYIADHKKDTVRMYVRLSYTVESAVMLDRIKEKFGEVKVLGRNGEPSDEVAFITPFASEEAILSQLSSLKDSTVLSTLRLLD